MALCLAVLAADADAQPQAAFVRLSAAATSNVAQVDVVRQRRVEIPVAGILADDAQSRTLILDLFPDVSFRAVRQQLAPTAHGVSWVGTLEGYPQSNAVFVLVGGEVMGHVYAPFGFFRIDRQLDGSYLAQQVDLGAREPNDVIEAPPDAAAGRATAPAAPLMLDDGSAIDVLVAFTADAQAGWGSEVRARAAIDLVVAETNQALATSGIATRVRMVHAARVDYAESGDSVMDLTRLRLPSDGFLDDVGALREAYQADAVALITEAATSGICGQGYLPGRSGSPTFAFSVTRRSCTANGRTFAHELGHNLGAHHDWYETVSTGVGTYSKGYVSLAGRFLDLMAYFKMCTDSRLSCTQVLAYSTPAVTRDGLPMGVPGGTNTSCTAGNLDNPPCDADAARTIAEMATVVSQYRNSSLSIIARQILPGGSLRSPNLRYVLMYQTDGNLVLSNDVSKAPLWATHTSGTVPGVAKMQADGNFVLYDSANVPLWASGTAGNPDAYFSLQNDGNFVIYRADGVPLWGTGTAQ